jgi:hypothetical protein
MCTSAISQQSSRLHSVRSNQRCTLLYPLHERWSGVTLNAYLGNDSVLPTLLMAPILLLFNRVRGCLLPPVS